MQKLTLNLNEAQVRKLINGHPIQIDKEKLNGSQHYLMVHPSTHKRATTARMKGKGIRVALTPEELQMSGQGFMDILRKIGKAATFVKDKIIDSSFYQQNIRPEVKALVNAGTTALANVLPGPVANIATKGINAIGEQTGAFGLPTDMVGVIHTTVKPKRITKKNAAAIMMDTKVNSLEYTKSKPSRKKSTSSGSFVIQ